MSAPPPRTPVLATLAFAVPLVLAIAAVCASLVLAGSWQLAFAHPWWLASLPVALGVYALAWGVYRPYRATPGASSARLFVSRGSDFAKLPRTWRVVLAPLPGALRLVAIVLTGVALARPQRVDAPESVELSGIDIVVALDLSGSMAAADLQPTRIEAAKGTIVDFIARRRTDRIGLVVFAREAFPALAPTLDYQVLTRQVQSLDLDSTLSEEARSGTAIGDGLGTALNYLRRSDARSKVVVLLTDGANNAGHLDPNHASQFARALGVKVFTVLMGQSDEAPVALRDPRGRIVTTQMIRSPVDPELLQRIAQDTDGQFFRAGDRASLEQAFHTILDRLERSRIADAGVQHTELFPYLVIPAVVLLALELLLSSTVLRRFP